MKSALLRKTDRSLPIALLRARETVMGPLREMLSESGISEQKWRVLRVMEECGPLPLTAIAEKACLLAPSVTRIIQGLEKDGLLKRDADGHDRRKSTVKITRKGRSLIRAHSTRSNEIFTRLETQFGERKLNRLLDLLDELQRVQL